jgi:tetratricopeptide (TPR) repeat protein
MLRILGGLGTACLFAVAWPAAVRAHGDLHEQIQALTAEIAKDPANAMLRFRRGELHAWHEDGAAALEDFRKAEELDPSLAIVDLARGRLWLRANKPAEARAALDRFLSRHPEHADARIGRARALAKLGEHRAAADDYARALESHPDPRPEHYVERARALAASGSAGEAVRALDEGMRRLGPAVTLQLEAIDLEVAAKQFDAALARVDGVLASVARRESWLLRRGEILRAAGREKEARESFGAALRSIEALPSRHRSTALTLELERRARVALEATDGGR